MCGDTFGSAASSLISALPPICCLQYTLGCTRRTISAHADGHYGIHNAVVSKEGVARPGVLESLVRTT